MSFVGAVAGALLLAVALAFFLLKTRGYFPSPPRSQGLSEGNMERVLFVDTANINRSRAAEDLYREDGRYEVRSRGVAWFATRRLALKDLLWADRIFVMNESEGRHRTTIWKRFGKPNGPIVDLDQPNLWLRRGDPELVRLLLERLRRHLGAPAVAKSESEADEQHLRPGQSGRSARRCESEGLSARRGAEVFGSSQ